LFIEGEKLMKLITIPPYKVPNQNPKEGRFIETAILDHLRKKGQLQGVEMDIDEGYLLDHPGEGRDEEFLANISVGMIKKVREYCDTGKYDAIICLGSMGMGFMAAREISRIPVVTSAHSAFHVASLVGDRFTVIEATDPQALIARHWAQIYGFSEKLAAVRYASISTALANKAIRQHWNKEKGETAELKQVIKDMTAQCVAAINEDRIDSLILSCTPLQYFEDEIRRNLDELGYDEIRLISQYSAAIEMAKVMVNMRLVQSPRAYPSDALKVKPKYR
jgi:allantoin racemase